MNKKKRKSFPIKESSRHSVNSKTQFTSQNYEQSE